MKFFFFPEDSFFVNKVLQLLSKKNKFCRKSDKNGTILEEIFDKIKRKKLLAKKPRKYMKKWKMSYFWNSENVD